MIRGRGEYVRTEAVMKQLSRDENMRAKERFPGLDGEFGDMIATIAPTLTDTPEMRLIAEVMLSAVEILEHGPNGKWDDAYAETRRWVKRESEDWPYYFNPICERLGLNPDATRKVLLEREPTGRRLEVKTIFGFSGVSRHEVTKTDRVYGGWNRRKSHRYGDQRVA